MGKLMNLKMKGKQLVTSFGLLQFDSEGIVDLPDEKEKEFLGMKGFEIMSEGKDFEQEATKNPSDKLSTTGEEKPQQEDKENAPEEENQESDEVVSEEIPDFDKLNVPQLKKYAKEHNIDLAGANKKDEIVSIIVNSEK